jgi:DNA-binding YbaB/EbfC family protein
MNMQQLMKQAQKMQEQLQKQMETTVVASAGGMVSVKMNGNKQLLSVAIDQEVFSGNDKEMLQDLIATVNEGIRKVDEALAGQLGNPPADENSRHF